MVKLNNSPKGVKTRAKKMSAEDRPSVWSKIKNGFRKGVDWVRYKAIPWVKDKLIPGIGKFGRTVNNISNTISATTETVGTIGGIIGGDTGKKMENWSNEQRKKQEEFRKKKEEITKKGEAIYNAGRDLYNTARQNMKG